MSTSTRLKIAVQIYAVGYAHGGPAGTIVGAFDIAEKLLLEEGRRAEAANRDRLARLRLQEAAEAACPSLLVHGESDPCPDCGWSP